MSFLLAWLVFPLILGLLSLGCGLFVDRTARLALPGALLPPIGLAVIVVVAQIATLSDATAELAVPAVIVIALAGGVLAQPWTKLAGVTWRSLQLDPWAVGACAFVFAVFAAPVVFSGSATWAGYSRIDDTAPWLAVVDRVMEHGRNVSGVPLSSYKGLLDDYVASGYPIGSFLPWGVGRSLVGQDAAWLFQPYMAFLGAMLALSLYSLAARVVGPAWQRALVAAVAAQPALLFGYSLVGEVKEVASAATIGLAAALVPLILGREDLRGLIPLAIVTGAAFSIMSFGAAIWFLPLLVALAGFLWIERGRRFALRRSAWFAILSGALLLPALPAAIDFLGSAPKVLTKAGDLGGLHRPLSVFQLFGVWLAGDFRFRPHGAFTYILIAVVIVAIVGGLVWAASRRAYEPVIYLGAVIVAVIVVGIPGAPWVDAKAFAIASPAFLFAAMVGAMALFGVGRPLQAAIVTVLIAGGVLWSNTLAYHDATLAPRDKMNELRKIGDRIAGQGPTFMVDRELYGAGHFLRDAAPLTASDDKIQRVPLTIGGTLGPNRFADIDAFKVDALLSFRTLVVPHSPATSRPPSVFKPVWIGRYYEVWQQPKLRTVDIAYHLPLDQSSGSAVLPFSRPACSDVLKAARLAGPTGTLAVSEHRFVTVLNLSQFTHPPSWRSSPNNPALVLPDRSGTASARIRIPTKGRYDFWLGGAFTRPVEVSVDGKVVGRSGYKVLLSGEFKRLAKPDLEPGVRLIELKYGGDTLHPGSGAKSNSGQPFPIGPFVLGVAGPDHTLTSVPPEKARKLCGKVLDWIEAVRPL